MEITTDRWRDELDSFSRQYAGWLVSVRVADRRGQVQTEARDLPLAGVSLATPQSHDVVISVGNGSHVTHAVHDAVAMSLDVGEDGAARALVLRARDGTTTSVEFRTPMRPEEVDGIVRH